jgi:CubicO group peptidase (beta-lactamase class C family)
MTETPATRGTAQAVLERYAGSRVPGLQYLVVDADSTLFEFAGGWADIGNRRAMTPDTTLMAYSMTKTVTAVTVLQLAEEGKLGLDDALDDYLPDTPYRGGGITIRQLLDHTAGLPNPIPLRWVHSAEEDPDFDEDAALARVMHGSPDLAFEPGLKYGYSNIGYWLLGKIVERAAGRPYAEQVRARVLAPLGLAAGDMGFAIADPARHANGYLAKFSLANLAKGFVSDSRYWGGYEGAWLRLESHQLNGPAFGGLIGTARGFARFLQDQLRRESVLFSARTKALLETAQTNRAGQPIRMTLGWHVGAVDGISYLFKEGGGGGFHGEMRLYPAQGIASVVLANDTGFNSRRFLKRMDGAFLHE